VIDSLFLFLRMLFDDFVPHLEIKEGL